MLIGLVVAALGIGAIFGVQFAYNNWTRKNRSAAIDAFAETSGVIVSSAVEQLGDESVGFVSYFPAVEYSYEVGGKKLQGKTIRLLTEPGDDEDGDDNGAANAKAVSARYPVGRAVTVFYNLHAVEMSCLERGAASA